MTKVSAGRIFRLLLAAFFSYIGLRKFVAVGPRLLLFDLRSAPEWFRNLNGVLQISGAALLMITRKVLVGVWLLGCTMAASIVTWLVVFEEPRTALIPAAILTALILVALNHLQAQAAD